MPEILCCDNHVLALIKPAGMPVVPDASEDHSLLEWGKDWIAKEFNKPGRVFLGVVHRLDRPVSGIVVFGRTSKGAGRLSESWRAGKVKKIYRGVSDASPTLAEGDQGEITQWLLKDRERNVVRVVSPNSHPQAREGRSRWKVLSVRGGKTLLELEPITGRPHQLRLACAEIGLPLMGDLKYGAKTAMAGRRIALHARELHVQHPILAEDLHLLSPDPWS